MYPWFYKQHEPNINETPYQITVKYGGKTEEFTGSIKSENGRIHVCTFTLGNTNSPRNPNNPSNPFNQGNNRDELQRKRDELQRQLDDIDRRLRDMGSYNIRNK